MARTNPNLNGIEKIYRKNYFDSALFNWVEGQRSLFKAVSISQSVQLFIKYYNLGESSVETMTTNYLRMQKEYYEAMKSK